MPRILNPRVLEALDLLESRPEAAWDADVGNYRSFLEGDLTDSERSRLLIRTFFDHDFYRLVNRAYWADYFATKDDQRREERERQEYWEAERTRWKAEQAKRPRLIRLIERFADKVDTFLYHWTDGWLWRDRIRRHIGRRWKRIRPYVVASSRGPHMEERD